MSKINSILCNKGTNNNGQLMQNVSNLAPVVQAAARLGEIIVRARVEKERLRNERASMKCEFRKHMASLKCERNCFKEKEISKRQMIASVKEVAMACDDPAILMAYVEGLKAIKEA